MIEQLFGITILNKIGKMNIQIKKYFSDRNSHLRTNSKIRSVSKENISLIKRNSILPWVELKNLKVPFKKIYEEYLKAENVKFYDHRKESLNKGWCAHTLYGFGEDKTLGYLHYRRIQERRKWSSSIKYFPEIYKFVKMLPYMKLYEVRLLLLKSKGYISPHIDLPLMCLDPLNIAIHFPKKCFFKFTKFGYIPFSDGKSFVLNIGYEHSVWNESEEPRLHLVINGKKEFFFYDVLL